MLDKRYDDFDFTDIEEWYNERAGILEFEADMPRARAESHTRTALRVYTYKITDSPRWLFIIAPGCELKEVEFLLREKFRERFIMVKRYQVNMAQILARIESDND